MSPPYGYAIVDEDHDWFNRGGISIQPLHNPGGPAERGKQYRQAAAKQ